MDMFAKMLLAVSGVCALLLLTLISQHVQSHPDDSYRATVDRVVDGDTVDLNISLWPDLIFRQRVRIFGIDTPELRSPRPCERVDAGKASERAKEWMPVGSIVSVNIFGVGKYGRPLGVVTTLGGGNVGDSLVEAGLALPYFGEKKEIWKCLEREG